MIIELKKYPKFFVVNQETFDNIMMVDLKICFVAGIPYSVISGSFLKPLVGVNIKELSINTPIEILSLLQKILKNEKMFIRI